MNFYTTFVIPAYAFERSRRNWAIFYGARKSGWRGDVVVFFRHNARPWQTTRHYPELTLSRTESALASRRRVTNGNIDMAAAGTKLPATFDGALSTSAAAVQQWTFPHTLLFLRVKYW